MGTVIIFEFKKFILSKKNLILIAVLSLIIGMWCVLNHSLDMSINGSKAQLMINDIETLKGQINVDENSSNEKRKKNMSMYKNDLKLWQERLEAYQKKDYNEYLRKQIEINENDIKNIRNGTVFGGRDIEEMESENELNKLLIAENLKPINEGISMEGFNFIRLLGTSPTVIIFMILIISLTAGTISSEYDRGTWKLLFTQSIPKWKITIGKWLSAIIINVLTITVISTVYFLALSTINGFGSLNYPVQYFTKGAVQYIPMGSFILKEIFMGFVIVIFLTTFSLFISRINKTTAGSVSLSIIISVALYMLSLSGVLKKFNSINPFSYMDITNVLSGAIETVTMFSVLQFSALYLALISAILLITTIILNKLPVTR